MRVFVLLSLAAVLIDVGAAAQLPVAPPRDRGPVFYSKIDLVTLNVSVTDAQAQFVGNLAQENFEVFENGRKQDLLFFAAGRIPLDVAIAIDSSSSMEGRLEAAQQAAIGLLRALQPADRVTVISFNDRAHIVQPLAHEIDAAALAIRRTVARGSTSLYDALYLAMRQLAVARARAGTARRPAIVLLSDGDDTTSLVTYEDVLELAKESDIAVYAIAFLPPADPSWAPPTKRGTQPRYALKSLASESGGRAFFPTAVGELAPIYARVADELANQYTLGYSPSDATADGAFRRVVVRLVNRPGALVHTRSGYKAPSSRGQ
jgi:Ca-activated chloride channel family protein